jgi:hypothetical protein
MMAVSRACRTVPPLYGWLCYFQKVNHFPVSILFFLSNFLPFVSKHAPTICLHSVKSVAKQRTPAITFAEQPS